MVENGFSFSKLVSLGALLWDWSMGLAARCQESDQEEHGDVRLANRDATPPPLGAKLTSYRLLNITIVFSFGIAKAILTYKGQSTAPRTLDWVGGALLTVL
ncbi:hypothetical protein EDB86DRAFT_404581 [Lactarius hatsudake]|nr:hypothetical protein EDB86DRAFT_404581 [Lactarius hatsudake]